MAAHKRNLALQSLVLGENAHALVPERLRLEPHFNRLKVIELAHEHKVLARRGVRAAHFVRIIREPIVIQPVHERRQTHDELAQQARLFNTRGFPRSLLQQRLNGGRRVRKVRRESELIFALHSRCNRLPEKIAQRLNSALVGHSRVLQVHDGQQKTEPTRASIGKRNIRRESPHFLQAHYRRKHFLNPQTLVIRVEPEGIERQVRLRIVPLPQLVGRLCEFLQPRWTTRLQRKVLHATLPPLEKRLQYLRSVRRARRPQERCARCAPRQRTECRTRGSLSPGAK